MHALTVLCCAADSVRLQLAQLAAAKESVALQREILAELKKLNQRGGLAAAGLVNHSMHAHH